MTRKTAAKTAATIPQPHGGALLPGGQRGNKGGGRLKDEFKDWCRSLLEAKTCQAQVKEILDDKGHPAFKAMWAAVADRAHGKPKEQLEVTGKDGAPIVVKYVHEDRKRTAS